MTLLARFFSSIDFQFLRMEYVLLKLEIVVTFIAKDNSLVEIVSNGVIFQIQKSCVLAIKIAVSFILYFLVIYWKKESFTY